MRCTRPLLTLSIVAGALLPAGASAAPATPATAGDAWIDDPQALTRLGLVVSEGVAPAVVPSPLTAGLVATDRPASLGGPYPVRTLGADIVVGGKNGWLLRGASVAALRVVGFDTRLGGARQAGPWSRTADGGVVVTEFSGSDYLRGYGPDLRPRWSTVPADPLTSAPVPSAPFAVAGGRVFALGGAPAVLDAVTGARLASLSPPPAGQSVFGVTAAGDGSARAVAGEVAPSPPLLTRSVAVHRLEPDGRRAWSTTVATATGALGLDTTAASVGPDGTTYLGVATTNGISRWGGLLIAVAADGVVRWTVPVGGAPSRPTVDRGGRVWTVTSAGDALALDPATGDVRFRRLLVASRVGGTVAADADGVLASIGGLTVALSPRAASAARPPVSVTLRPSVRLQAAPLRCISPHADGREATCVYRLASGTPLRVTTPVDGTAAITIAPVTPIRVRVSRTRTRLLPPARTTVTLLAGGNQVALNGLHSLLSVCRSGRPCEVKPGDYRVTVVVRAGATRGTFVRTLRVLPSTGRWVD